MKGSKAVQCEQLPNYQALVQIFVRNGMNIFKTKLFERIKSNDTEGALHFSKYTCFTRKLILVLVILFFN